MSAAQPTQTFDPDGAPVSVLVDFDGTISLLDVGDRLLERLYDDPAEVARLDRLYDAGEMGSRELMRWDMDVLPRDEQTLWREIDDIGLDETLVDLVARVRSVGAAIEVVSDGLGFHVEPMLGRLGLDDVPVATNATIVGQGGAGMSFPFGHPSCFVCGTCKRERVRRHQEAGRAVVFVGDGTSDRYAAHHADVVFAKGSLAAWCVAEDVAHESWRVLADVADWLEPALSDGRLPGDRVAYDAWSEATRAASRRSRPFICGPEVWGPDRIVPDTLES